MEVETWYETSKRFNEVYQLYEEGFGTEEIAKQLDLSPFAVQTIIKKKNIKYKSDGEFKNAIIEACADFGIPKCFAIRLYNTLRRNGVVKVINGKELVLANKYNDYQLLHMKDIGTKSVRIIRKACEI